MVSEIEPLVSELSQKSHAYPGLSYISDLKNLGIDVDCVLISGTLQYLSDPVGVLSGVLELQPGYVFIQKTPYWSFPTRLTKQLSWKNEGFAVRQSYPFWILNEEDIVNRFVSNGYRKRLDNPGRLMYVTKRSHVSYRSLLFTCIGL